MRISVPLLSLAVLCACPATRLSPESSLEEAPESPQNSPPGGEAPMNPGGSGSGLPPVAARVSEFTCEGAPQTGPAVTARRTRDEIAQVLSDALGVDLAAVVRRDLPEDLRADGFTNQAGGQVLTVEHVAAFEALGVDAAGAVGNLGDFLAALGGNCATPTACRVGFVDELGRRLFGRAPGAEASAYLSLFDAAQSEGLDEGAGAGLVIQAMIQAPDFLYPLDRPGAEGNVDALALARRLAGWVWLSSPDPTLVAAAEAGELETEAQIEAQVRRMLQDPRARSAARRFVADWLHLDRLESLAPDATRFPGWQDSLREAMRDETLAFFDHLVWALDRPLPELFDANLTFATAELAELYGLPDVSGDPSAPRVLEGVPERGGLLTHASVLTVGGERASLVERGLFVLETLLCGSVEAPPVDVVMLMGDVAPGVTQRTFSEQRMASPSCGSCHVQMDPLAYALERFDGIGGYAEVDRFGNAVRSDGLMAIPDDPDPIAYTNVAELASALADHPRVRACFVLKGAQYALGRRLVPEDGCHLARMRDRFEASDRTWSELMVAVATSPLFRAAGAP
ncbi:MAG: DUF1592 domain-containing protein [Myxococcota bacterium]